MGVLILLLALPAMTLAEQGDDPKRNVEQPTDGELVLPDDYNEVEQQRCLVICSRWGQNCTVNPRTGSRTCRRACKSYTQECS